MSLRDGMLLFAAAGHLVLAVLSLVRGGRSSLSRPLALLCVDLFGWNFATLANHVTGAASWTYVDSVLTAVCPAFALHLMVAFVGARRARVRVLLVSYVVFGALAVSAAASPLSSWSREWIESRAFPLVLL